MAPRSLLVSALAATSLTLVNGASIQKKGLVLPKGAAANAQLARNAFSSAYADYSKYAWGHDDLTPVSASYLSVVPRIALLDASDELTQSGCHGQQRLA